MFVAVLIGWHSWTEWSLCNKEGEQFRKRTCQASKPSLQMCAGTNKQTRMCQALAYKDKVQVNSADSLTHPGEENDSSVGVVIGASTAAFLAGLIVAIAAVATIVIVKRRRRTRQAPARVPGSPHYIPARQNPYVSVPMQRGVADGKNTLLEAEDNTTPKIFSPTKMNDYETATIKRNSHSLTSGHNLRAELEDHLF